MKNNFNKTLDNKIAYQQNLPWVLFTLALFIVISISVLVQKRILSDGSCYASIAWNMAHGIGSLWRPIYTPTVLAPVFYEHPTLGMFVDSFFFRAFGSSFIVERIYCFTMLLLTWCAMGLVWFRLQPSANRYILWLLVFCWVIVPEMSHAYGGNAIELLLVVFTTFSVWIIICALQSDRLNILRLLLASICMSGAFFTNGFQAFFPLAAPFIYKIVFSRSSWKLIGAQTLLLILFTAAIIGAVFLYHPAYTFMHHYFFQQVFATFTHARIGNGNYRGFSHLMGIWMLLRNFLISLCIISVVFKIMAKKTGQPFFQIVKEKLRNKNVIFLFLIGVSASLPILASSRQMNHYFLQAFPFFILTCIVILTPIAQQWISHTDTHVLYYKKMLKTGTILVAVTTVIVIALYGHSPPMLQDVTAISKVVPNDTMISAGSNNVWNNWNLQGYFYRYHQIYFSQKTGAPFLLEDKVHAYLPAGYEKVDLSLHKFVLYKKSPRFTDSKIPPVCCANRPPFSKGVKSSR